jgi:hypothetical protein
MAILKDFHPQHVSDPLQKELISKAVDDEMQSRRE